MKVYGNFRILCINQIDRKLPSAIHSLLSFRFHQELTALCLEPIIESFVKYRNDSIKIIINERDARNKCLFYVWVVDTNWFQLWKFENWIRNDSSWILTFHQISAFPPPLSANHLLNRSFTPFNLKTTVKELLEQNSRLGRPLWCVVRDRFKKNISVRHAISIVKFLFITQSSKRAPQAAPCRI